jgi:cell wall-associated NlpC family hydrolase
MRQTGESPGRVVFALSVPAGKDTMTDTTSVPSHRKAIRPRTRIIASLFAVLAIGGAMFVGISSTDAFSAFADTRVDLRTDCPQMISEGATGDCVSTLQSMLNDKGASLDVDGDFGPRTKEAVVAFQGSNGLEADGIVGPRTKAALYGEEAPPAPPGGGDIDGNKVVEAARAYIGLPYSWGGGHRANPGPSLGTCSGYTGSIQPCPADSTVGLDCSGLVRAAYADATGQDILNGNTDGQLASPHVTRIDKSQAQPGDPVYFPGHVVIYAGNGMMIEAKQTGTDVHEVPMRSGGTYVRVHM